MSATIEELVVANPDTAEHVTPTFHKYPWADLVNTAEGEYATTREILEASGLDWGLELTPMYDAETRVPVTSTEGDMSITVDHILPEPEIVIAPDFQRVRRADTGVILGTVKQRYKPTTNLQAFKFIDNVIDDGAAKWVGAGEQNGGQKVFGVLRLPETVTVAGVDDHEMFMVVRTGHDGGTAVSVTALPIRIQCTNAMPLVTANAKVRWSMPHTRSLDGQLLEARQSLEMTFAYIDEFKELAEKLMNIKVGDRKALATIEHAIAPKRVNRQETIDSIFNTYMTSEVNDFRGTGWGVINAITEDRSHYGRHTASVKFSTAIDEEGFKASNLAVKRLLSTR